MSATLALLLGLALAAPAGRAAPAPCTKPAGATLLAADAGSKVWLVTIDGGPGAPDRRRYVACERGRAPFVFERGDTGASTLTDITAAEIRGRFLAYGRIRKAGLGTSRATIVVRDLRTHRAVFARRAVSKGLELEEFQSVVVRANGHVAWIASNLVGEESLVVYEVRKHDASGTALLDTGTDVDPGSLSLTTDGRVRWNRDVEVKYAPLT